VIKPETLDLPPLHLSFDQELGDYYQDFSAAIELVEGGFHGTLDEQGVPLVRHGPESPERNPIVTAQYAIANTTAFLKGDVERGKLARRLLDSLVADQESSGEWRGAWLATHDDPKYRWLKAPWTSSLTYGNCLSALLRGWQLFGEESYRSAADAAYASLHLPRAGAPLVDERDGDLWYEEYPGDPPLRVLNGHVYTALGVLDYARARGDDLAMERWQRAAGTTLRHIAGWDLGFWSAYDLRWREPATQHYHKNIHVPQLRILAALTGEAGFADVADRWSRQVGSLRSRARWEIAIRVHARRRR
jgi:hypothetical protein